MTLKPINIDAQFLKENIRLIATDMDGTLTQNGKFTPKLLQILTNLQKANMPVLIVTGRSAGWVQAIKNYLPIIGAISENGGLFFSANNDKYQMLTPIDNLTIYRQQLSTLFTELKAKFPQITESSDNQFRVTDWTFDVQGLTTLELTEMHNYCLSKGWGFTYSTVQCHIKPQNQNKAQSLQQVLKTNFPDFHNHNIITVGDSPNDESLFNPAIFPYSVGVANILHYQDKLQYVPTYITVNSEVKGFTELAEIFLQP